MNEILKNKRIILGVTGSIAAYKAPLLVRELIKRGAEVEVVITPSGAKFTTPTILSNLSKNPVISDVFDERMDDRGAWHILAANRADAMLVAPCSATTLAKLANGMADNALTAVALALKPGTPLLVSPAMDTNMWLHPATQANAEILRSRGAVIIPPASGPLASGLVGPGRMPELETIIAWLESAFSPEQEKICPRCGKKFICRHGLNCDCMKIKLTPGQSQYLKDNYDDCVCLDCLKDISEEQYEKDNDSEVKIEKETAKAEETDEIKVEFSSEKEAPKGVKVENLNNEAKKIIPDNFINAELGLENLKRKLGLKKDLFADFYRGKKVLIDAGPTHEAIDDVRFIGNESSGKMGYAIAEAARDAGAEVTLVSGPVSLEKPKGVKIIDVVSAGEMYDAVMKNLPQSDIVILAAAVADFTVSGKYNGKIKKEEMGDVFTLQLTRTKDILADAAKSRRAGQIVVGFALESSNEMENGREKLHRKNCDMIVVNSANKPDSGFAGDNNTIAIIDRNGDTSQFPAMTKSLCSVEILRKIATLK